LNDQLVQSKGNQEKLQKQLSDGDTERNNMLSDWVNINEMEIGNEMT
jgi:hypothetical protein